MTAVDLRERVAAERERRGYFSVRQAATAAEAAGAAISYTTWQDWENGKRPLGDKLRRAVMVLFAWPADWPENPPAVDDAVPRGEVSSLRGEVSSLRAELEAERAARRSEVQELRDTVEELIDQLGAIAAAVDDLRQRDDGAAHPRTATE